MTGDYHGGGFTVAMSRATAAPGIDIIDPIERRRCTLRTPDPVTPVEGSTDEFRFPVETAIDVQTEELHAPFTGHAYVRRGDGELVTEAVNEYEDRFQPADYTVELTGLIKVYLSFEGAFALRNGFDGVRLEFDDPVSVSIGSRSAHRRPATTITTTDAPEDLMAAISTFGSALKPTSPERTFPTLRGHPPAIEVGDTLDIPDGLTPPVDDVTIEVPPSYDHLFPVAPLAYYLGVGLDVGHIPRIVGPGVDHVLTHPEGFDRAVHRVLQQIFLLECATRTEGLYPVDLLERNRLEQRVSLAFADLYEAPVGERIGAYLDVPWRVIEDLVPDWRLAAHVEPVAEKAPILPYLANDLALITPAKGETLATDHGSPVPAGALTRGSSDVRGDVLSHDSPLVQPKDSPRALETAWVSGGMPVDATKAVIEAYENRLGRQPQTTSIEISVICNSPDMADELQVVDDVYGDHKEMPFELTVHTELPTHELESMIHEDFNFLHYIGHIDDDGFRCPDGRLDMTGIDDVGPEAFFLNACQSYEQGLSLIKGGAIGGIATLNDVVNHGAIRVGKSVAQLLNAGFPIRGALDIAATQSVIGRQYVVVGDGTLSIVQPPSGTPHVFDLEPTDDAFDVKIDCYGAPPGMGCMFRPYIDEYEFHNLAEGESGRVRVSEEELKTQFAFGKVPVRYRDEIKWGTALFED